MTKNIFKSLLIGGILCGTFITPLFAQTTQEYEQFFRDNPSLIKELLNSDGSVNKRKLEELRQNPGSIGLPDNLKLDQKQSPVDGYRSLIDIENANRLQTRLEEERMKAYKRQKEREAQQQETTPPD